MYRSSYNSFSTAMLHPGYGEHSVVRCRFKTGMVLESPGGKGGPRSRGVENNYARPQCTLLV
jgi:hypothetical protein